MPLAERAARRVLPGEPDRRRRRAAATRRPGARRGPSRSAASFDSSERGRRAARAGLPSLGWIGEPVRDAEPIAALSSRSRGQRHRGRRARPPSSCGIASEPRSSSPSLVLASPCAWRCLARGEVALRGLDLRPRPRRRDRPGRDQLLLVELADRRVRRDAPRTSRAASTPARRPRCARSAGSPTRSMTTSCPNASRYIIARRAAARQASGSSALTWTIGTSKPFARSEQ